MAVEPLDRPASPSLLRDLHDSGLLSDEALAAGLAMVTPKRAWWLWAERMLLLIGCALVLAGVVFFFAYNWANMGRFTKLGLVEAGLIGCVAAAWVRGPDGLAGKLLTLSAAVLTGVLLAVYGQVYQTGADPFELFLGWSVLILGWVLISRFGALWLVWLALLNTAAILYWQQVGQHCYGVRYEALWLGLAALNAGALALVEWGLRRRLDWLGPWLRPVLLAATVAALCVPAVGVVHDTNAETVWGTVALILWLGGSAAGFHYFRRAAPDLLSLAILVFGACVVVLNGVGKAIFETMDFDWGALPFAVAILAVVWAAAYGLRRIAGSMEGDGHG